MKVYLFFSHFFIAFIFSNSIQAQCPGCITNTTCTATPAKPTLCPDTLPEGYALQYYDEDITFYMPSQFVDQGTGFNVTLNRIEVTGVVGMPLGLNFQTSSSNDNFYPSSNPPSTEHGCAKICGTPILPGNYTIRVFVKAYFTALGVNQTQDDFFDIPVTIMPSASGNNSFTIQNPFGCQPLTTSFTSIHASNGNNSFSYLWDFGNGQTSTSETPPTQHYSQAGNYPVSLTTTIDTLGYYLSSVSVSNLQCDDGIWGAPDPYIKIFQGTTLIYQSNYVDDVYAATFQFPTIELLNNTYKIEVWDYDSFLTGGDDFCGQVFFNGHTAGAHSLNASGMNVSFTIDHPIIEFVDVDTISVFPLPMLSHFFVTPNDSACLGDSILLQTISDATIWQWFNDTMTLLGQIYPDLYAHGSGKYFVQLTNQHGCATFSDTVSLTFINTPPTPTFWQSGNTLETMLSGFDLQWYFEGAPMPGETNQTLSISQSGIYKLEAKNILGCSIFSNDYYATFTAIEKQALYETIHVYPNPAQNQLFINLNMDIKNSASISILNAQGLIVYEKNVSPEESDGLITLNIHELANGFYFLKLHSTEFSHTIKFVKL
jgi:hypothetical protein